MLFLKNARIRGDANRRKNAPIFILSCDGRGNRGIIIAEVLRVLEEELRMYGSARALTDSFDMYVATSSGSVISALLLATETPASEIRACLRQNILPFLAPNDQNVQVFGTSYIPKFHNESLLEGFHTLFGSLSCSSLRKRCIIPLYDILHTSPYTMISTHETDLPLSKVLLASCSIPKFFSPVQFHAHELSSQRDASMIDGSVYSPDSLLNGILSVYAEHGTSSDIYVLSIREGVMSSMQDGDGNDAYTTRHILYHTHAQNVAHLLSKIDTIYITRIDISLKNMSHSVFDFSSACTEFLTRSAIDIIHRNRIAIKQFAHKIITIKDK